MLVCQLELGRWNVLQNDLLELLVTQTQDKVLSFYIILLLVQLTELPQKGTPNFQELTDILIDYKLSFATKPRVFGTLVDHLAECVKSEQENSLNKAKKVMVEAIIYLFRNILQIPDEPEG